MLDLHRLKDDIFLRMDIVAKPAELLLGIPAFLVRVPGLSPGCSALPLQLPANVSGRQHVVAQILGFLPPTW